MAEKMESMTQEQRADFVKQQMDALGHALQQVPSCVE